MSGVGYRVLGFAGQALQVNFSGLSLLGFLFSTLALAIALRLLDDYIDLHFDQISGRRTLAAFLGEASVIYALLALAIAALISTRAAIALFFAAYAVGMVGDMQRRMPSGFTGYQEACLVLIIGAFGVGLAGMCWSFCLMAAWQCFDDYYDQVEDRRSNNRNLCRRWGSGEVIMAGLLFALLACWFSLLLTGLLLIAATIATIMWHTWDKAACNRLVAQEGERCDVG
jgi:4-hydroxybenzoate polyprenyltransferase